MSDATINPGPGAAARRLHLRWRRSRLFPDTDWVLWCAGYEVGWVVELDGTPGAYRWRAGSRHHGIPHIEMDSRAEYASVEGVKAACRAYVEGHMGGRG
jgi:hypothetical protein